MRSRLAFFGIAFISIVVFSISVGKNLGEATNQGTTLGLQGKLAQSSCQPPASGCPEGKYWDYYECRCRSESSGSSCQEPSGGCPFNYDWDDDICNCVYEGSTTSPSLSILPSTSPFPTDFDDDDSSFSGDGGIGGTPIYDESSSTNRLARVDGATMNCIRTRLNDTEFDVLRYLVPETADEREELIKIEEKAKICFESYQEVKNIEEASGKISELSGPVEACLRHEVGDLAFEEINSGLREPTEEEMRRGDRCFEGEYKSEIRYQTSEQDLHEDIKNCLKLAVGERDFDSIKEGTSEVSFEDREKVERCFGASPQPFQPRPQFEIPQEIDACLREGIGFSRYEEIKFGRSEPTDDERAKGEACFENLNETQVNFLPSPPEQVPFLQTSNIVEVAGVSEEFEELYFGLLDRKFVFSGTGPAGSVVNIYIFTEPIVVTTKTDENGDWVYELSQPLEGERHVAYATVRNQSGDIVRSAVFNFTVAAAEPGVGQLIEEDRKAVAETTRFLTYALALTAFVVVTVGGGGVYIFLKRSGGGSKKEKTGLVSKGEGEGDTGSGSVN
ncbi:hypothetical protein IID22_00340 [Patescibacteria group bacterium]|nr:hypothetical protein [Patescibacteria group bacterium]